MLQNSKISLNAEKYLFSHIIVQSSWAITFNRILNFARAACLLTGLFSFHKSSVGQSRTRIAATSRGTDMKVYSVTLNEKLG